jgi:hypothetical protein
VKFRKFHLKIKESQRSRNYLRFQIKTNLITWTHFVQLITVSGDASYLRLMNLSEYVSVFASRHKQIWFRRHSFAVTKEKRSTVSNTQITHLNKEIL